MIGVVKRETYKELKCAEKVGSHGKDRNKLKDDEVKKKMLILFITYISFFSVYSIIHMCY